MEKTTKPVSSQPQNRTVATQGTNAVAKKEPKEHEVFRSQLNHYEGTIVKLIQDSGIKPAKFMEMVYTAVRKQPALLDCDRASLFGAILTAAELGLIPNTPFGYCYIIPYEIYGKKTAQFQIGYQGLTQLMYRIPDVEKIESERVFAKDDFDYEIFPKKQILKHKPFKPVNEGETRGPLIAVYCTIKMRGISEPFFEITFKEDLDAIQKIAKAGKSSSSPYNNGTDVFNWMQRKVPIKQIFKTMRKETAPPVTNKALELEDVLEKGAVLKVDESGKVKISYLEGQEPGPKNKSLDKLIDDVPENEIEPVVVNQEYEMDDDPATQANRQFSSGSFEQPEQDGQPASQEGKLNL